MTTHDGTAVETGQARTQVTVEIPAGVVQRIDVEPAVAGMDIGYAVIGAMVPELRRTHERELLDAYRGQLLNAGIEAPDQLDMWTAYRRSPAWGFCM